MYDIAIIGAGPAGYTAAIRASQLGAKVLLVEKDKVGGTCLNRGCIPSKAFIASSIKYLSLKKMAKFGVFAENFSYDYSKMFERKESIVNKLRKGVLTLLKVNNVDLIEGEAQILDKNSIKVGEEKFEFKNLIIATGSKCISLPNLKVDNKFIFDTDGILALSSIPDNILIVGSGASGVEWAGIFNALEKNVTIVEIADNFLPAFDSSVQERIERIFKIKRIKAFKSTSISKINGKKAELSNGEIIEPDMIMLSAGRTVNLDIKGLEILNLEKNGKFIKADDNFKTNIDNIFAIGDVNGKLMLAHSASHQAISVVDYILKNKKCEIDYNLIPKVIYGSPEIAMAGITEQSAISQNIEYKTSNFPVSALGKAAADDDFEGFIKLISSNDKIIGVHIIAKNASELIHSISTGMKAMNISDFEESVFAHPTYSEGVGEAILGLNGNFINAIRK